MTMLPTRRSGQTPSRMFFDPSHEFADIYDRMGQLMSLAFGGFGLAGDGARAPWAPPADVSETEDAYLIRAELPGVSKDRIEVFLQDRELVIRGEVPDTAQGDGQEQPQQQAQEQSQQQGQEQGQARQHRSTRRTGRFEYRVYLPDDIQADQVTAELTDGVLTVRVPKSEDARPRRIEISG